MNSYEFEADPKLREGLRTLSIPQTPPELESRVQKQIRRRRVQRGLLASSSGVALVVMLFVWAPWRKTPATLVQHPRSAPKTAQTVPPTLREIPHDELAVLFAPPPVGHLTILDRMNNGLVTALNRLENVK